MTPDVPSLLAKLTQARIRLATVESCTGGLLAHRLTEISGASSAYWGGWVVYDNSAKTRLGVAEKILRDHGAVSAETARALAESGLTRLRQTLGETSPLRVLATTGIAGPTGGTAQKPVGLCFIGLASWDGRNARIQASEVRAPQTLNRSETKVFFADRALELLEGSLQK